MLEERLDNLEKKVDDILENHLPTLEKGMNRNSRSISFVKGQLYIVIPLSIALIILVTKVLLSIN